MAVSEVKSKGLFSPLLGLRVMLLDLGSDPRSRSTVSLLVPLVGLETLEGLASPASSLPSQLIRLAAAPRGVEGADWGLVDEDSGVGV